MTGLRAGEVATAAGVNRQTLRYYERVGLLNEPDRTLGGHRTYPEETLIVIRVIKAAQRLGFTLAEVAELLDLGGHRHAEPGLQARASAKLAEVEDEQGVQVYVGHVGTGFSQAALAGLQQRLEKLGRPTSPFGVVVPREHARHARWVEPELVGEVEFRQRASDGRLRHPAWRGMRPD